MRWSQKGAAVFIRENRVKRGDKVYEYRQLVESYRDKDGKSKTRVVANVSHLSAQQLENLKVALRAGAEGKSVVLKQADAQPFTKVSASLRYLDIAVLLRLWHEWKLDELLGELMPMGRHSVAPADLVAALVLQRALEPDSKLAATEWFPGTALPELLGIRPDQFNNSRVHRTLDLLESVDEELQAQLPARYASQSGAFTCLFLDATDTFFVGRGPEMAELGKTKEGRVELKVGILLLCNERGEPIRWKVVQGNSAENKTFHEVFRELEGAPWAHRVPLVVDRAMGRTVEIEKMAAVGLHYLTALTANEFDSYAPEIPRGGMGSVPLDLRSDPVIESNDKEALIALAQEHGFTYVSEDLMVLDLGVRPIGGGSLTSTPDTTKMSQAQDLRDRLLLAREIKQRRESGELKTLAEAGRVYGCSHGHIANYLALTQLSSAIQREVEAGLAEGIGFKNAIRLGRLRREKQMERYLELKAKRRQKRAAGSHPQDSYFNPDKIQARQVLYFNPGLHLHRRRKLLEKLDQAQLHVSELNDKIAQNRIKRSTARLVADIESYLANKHLRKAFEIHADEEGFIQLEENETYLTHLRGRYGFCVLVGHPELIDSATELVHMYRAKQTVEADFKTIKSCIQLRPVHHQTDAKVRAHVTLCMLALLLHRTLESRLQSMQISPARALSRLQQCPLNKLDQADIYTVTMPDLHQSKILKELKMTHLTEDDHVRQIISSRHCL